MDVIRVAQRVPVTEINTDIQSDLIAAPIGLC
jgi:hypothetical protein